jgi:DNA-binding PucR family transcriptional regulator
VTYRLRRIEEITGLRLAVYRDRLMAQVALEIVNGPVGAASFDGAKGLS